MQGCGLRVKDGCTGMTGKVVEIYHGDSLILACAVCAPTSTGFCAKHQRGKGLQTDGTLSCETCENERDLPARSPIPENFDRPHMGAK